MHLPQGFSGAKHDAHNEDMPLIVEAQSSRFDGNDKPLHSVWISIGKNLGGFRFPRETILRVRPEISVPESVDIPAFKDILRHSHSIEFPARYKLWAIADDREIRLGITHDHMTQALAWFLTSHGNNAQIIPLERGKKSDVILNAAGRDTPIAIPMLENQKVTVEVLQRDNHQTRLFEHPAEVTTRPHRANA